MLYFVGRTMQSCDLTLCPQSSFRTRTLSYHSLVVKVPSTRFGPASLAHPATTCAVVRCSVSPAKNAARFCVTGLSSLAPSSSLVKSCRPSFAFIFCIRLPVCATRTFVFVVTHCLAAASCKFRRRPLPSRRQASGC